MQIEADGRFPDRENKAFDQREDVVLIDETHLDVDLRELRLPIDTQILVAEASNDLKIPFVTRNHEELLE